jgi:hypothetical protein
MATSPGVGLPPPTVFHLLKEVVFFIGGTGGTDHTNCSTAAVFVTNVSKAVRNQRERLVPRSGLQLGS